MDLKQDIYNMIRQINNEKDLKEIAKLCKQKTAITLDEYIDIELQCAPNNIKNKFKCEVIDLYCKMDKDNIHIDKNPCGDWCDLIIEGLLLFISHSTISVFMKPTSKYL